MHNVQPIDPAFAAEFPHIAAAITERAGLLAAWQVGADVPVCVRCSSVTGPFVPTGQRRPSGAQVFTCVTCDGPRQHDDEQGPAPVSHDEAMAAYREIFDEQQTHVIRLLDEPGATMIVRCPDWCESDHLEDETHGTYLVDFAHRGSEVDVHVDLGDGDHEDILLCEITQYPFGRDMRKPVALLWPTLGMTEAVMDADKLVALAGQLRDYAAALEQQAVRLEQARGER